MKRLSSNCTRQAYRAHPEQLCLRGLGPRAMRGLRASKYHSTVYIPGVHMYVLVYRHVHVLYMHWRKPTMAYKPDCERHGRFKTHPVQKQSWPAAFRCRACMAGKTMISASCIMSGHDPFDKRCVAIWTCLDAEIAPTELPLYEAILQNPGGDLP